MSLNLEQASSFTGVLSRAGAASANLVRGGAATTVTPQNTTFAIDGKLFYAASATIGTATPTTDAATGRPFAPLLPRSACAYVFCLTAAGALRLVQGPVVANACDEDGTIRIPPSFPAIPAGLCPLSYVIASASAAASASGWLIGTNNYTGVTGVTVSTAVDLAGLPPSPQTA